MPIDESEEILAALRPLGPRPGVLEIGYGTGQATRRLGTALVLREVPKGGFLTRDTPPLPGTPPIARCGFYAEDRLVGLDPPFNQLRADLIRARDDRSRA